MCAVHVDLQWIVAFWRENVAGAEARARFLNKVKEVSGETPISDPPRIPTGFPRHPPGPSWSVKMLSFDTIRNLSVFAVR